MIIGRELVVEKLYSEVIEDNDLLQELCEKAFCDGYEYAQREFARKDYEGLTDDQASKLRSERNEIAKYLREQRNKIKSLKDNVSADQFNEAKKYVYENSLKEAKSSSSAKRAKILAEGSVDNKVNEVVDDLVNNSIPDNNVGKKNIGRFNKVTKFINKNKLPILATGATLGTLGYLKYKNNKRRKELEKNFSNNISPVNEEDHNGNNKLTGAMVGTGIAGGLGTWGASGLAGRMAEMREGSKAARGMRAAYREGLKKLQEEKVSNDSIAKSRRARAQNSDSIYDMMFRSKVSNELDKKYADELRKNDESYKEGVRKLKNSVRRLKGRSNNAVRIAGRNARIGMATVGTLGTLGALGGVYSNKKKEDIK